MRQNQSHQSVQAALLKRIHSGEWTPGTYIPGEVDLAAEYGCSRTTVNRALRQLAENGIVERKRKRGTRVTPMPVARATLEIPVIRQEVMDRGGQYQHSLLLNKLGKAPASVYARLQLPEKKLLHLQSLHLCDSKPYMFEDRWVNTAATPNIEKAPFDKISPNEWLIQEIPYSDGDISFSACAATPQIAEHLETSVGAPLFLIERTTRMNETAITTLKMYYGEGFRMSSTL
ncbi:GntR family transcriptional regulator [Sneathiella sp.]|jgi:GntR family histidine utilization transcriptional repressor|uniref:GntR family transcriptional regulator n=1 Tax=Sneathiella sp. TaxID=1964365 RepID=UPI0039E4E3F2